MDALFDLKKWLGQLLMPLPFSLSLLLLALLLLWFTRFQKTGKLLATLSLLLVTLMGMRPVSYELARGLEQTFPPFETSQHPDIEAIVVLGNGHVSDPAVPERSWQNNIALARTLEGVRLAQAYPQAELIFFRLCIGRSPLQRRGQRPHGGESRHSPRADDVV